MKEAVGFTLAGIFSCAALITPFYLHHLATEETEAAFEDAQSFEVCAPTKTYGYYAAAVFEVASSGPLSNYTKDRVANAFGDVVRNVSAQNYASGREPTNMRMSSFLLGLGRHMGANVRAAPLGITTSCP